MSRVIDHRRRRIVGIGLGLAVLCAAGLWRQTVSEAGGPPLPAQVAAVVDGKQLHVAVALTQDAPKRLSGTLQVELLGEAGQRLDVVRADLQDADALAAHRLDLPAPAGGTDGLRLRISLNGRKAEVQLRQVLLVKAHETAVTGGQELYAGAPASLACAVHGVRSIAEMVPLPGSTVIVRLRNPAGKSTEVYKGRTGAEGRADVQFEVPDVPAGAYTLEVATRSALGEEKVDRPVTVRSDAKILLVSDRPIYQPGHVIHLRALVLRPFDLRPVEGKDLRFEVEDPKGNKVFKRTFKTSGYGVAAVDFQLADEVNMGDYHLRAMLGDTRAEKTVQVKRYVLPKFKVEVKADKTFYLPKETLKVDVQTDYFFGKPVAPAKVELTASTFDVAFHVFHTWKGETDENGHAKLEITLPPTFVGQPLQKGDALVKLDVKVHDSAEHTEAVTKTYPVSDQPVRVSLIPEGGKIVPGMQNRIFVAATYPDGSSAPDCGVTLWHEKLPAAAPPFGAPGFFPGGPVPLPPPGPPPGVRPKPRPPAVPGGAQPVALEKKVDDKAEAKVEPLATVKTNAAGLAEFTLKPAADQLRPANWGPRDVEMLGGKQQRFGPQIVYDVRAVAKDAKGGTATAHVALNSHPMGENVLLRLDKAVYRPGDRMAIDVRTSAGMPTVFVDVVRGGQIMLSKWLEVKDGKAAQALDLPPSVFGSLEVHAYQMLQSGEIIRDSRVVYVQPRTDLKVTVQAGKPEFAPGEDAMIRFRVTDAQGKPAAAALAVIIVDEAVYALQDTQPGLERVYFTLQEELLKPQAQVKFAPGERLDDLVRQPVLPPARQQVAEVLLTAAKLPPPRRFVVDPARERRQRAEGQVQQIAAHLFNYAQQHETLRYDSAAARWTFRPGLLAEIVKANFMQANLLTDVFDRPITFEGIRAFEKDFTPDALGRAVTAARMVQVHWSVVQYTNQDRNRFLQAGRWVLPATLLDEMVKAKRIDPGFTKDAWGGALRLVRLEKKAASPFGQPQFEEYEIISGGPDRKLSTADDVRLRNVMAESANSWPGMGWWLAPEERRERAGQGAANQGLIRGFRDGAFMQNQFGFGGPMPPGAGFAGGMPAPAAAMPPMAMPKASKAKSAPKGGPAPTNAPGAAPDAPRVREFFPETMLWQPSLITDEQGEANLSLRFADSITTWRLSASANSKGGALGGATVPLKVFQDFFVDIDLPVSLTQGDEIAFPVAVYNYLPTPQTVKIELQKETWFELLDQGGLVRSLDLKPNEVTSVKFRVRAGKIGAQPFTVKAFGSKKSDAVKRTVEVVPNGQRIERVASDRLKGKVSQVIDIPASALPDASKLLVRIYPGVMAQVLEGVEGLIRLPGG